MPPRKPLEPKLRGAAWQVADPSKSIIYFFRLYFTLYMDLEVKLKKTADYDLESKES